MRKSLLTLFIVAGLCSKLLAQHTIFSDNFESGTLDNEHWKAYPGTDGIVEVASTLQGVQASHQGTYGVALGKSTGGGYTTNSLDLHLDLSGYENILLSFWIKDNNDATDGRDGIWFSDDGGQNFKKAYSFNPASWTNEYGQFPPIDVTGLAADSGLALTSNFVIRFQQYGYYSFQGGGTDGLFLDDVSVTSSQIEYASLPFLDDFETGSLGSAWTWSDPTFPTATTDPSTLRPDGIVAVVGNIQGVEAAHQGLYGAVLGKRPGTSGSYTTNSLDLHLDLAGYQEVELSFWIKDNNDATNDQDGIWFSNDGGKHFKKVYAFNPAGWTNQYGQLPPIDVDELAIANGLTLTRNFVIRFQQYGYYNFQGGGTDGFLLDDIAVTSPRIEYASLPFADDFETGSLGSAWTWSDPTFPTVTTDPSTIRPDGIVAVVGNIQGVEAAHLGLYGVAMGKRSGTVGSYTSNALDLHLDLSGQEQVELSFWIKHNTERTEIHDGIFYSPNGGKTFRSIYPFQFLSSRAGIYERVSLNLDSLIAVIGLPYSATSVIRFQQYGYYSFQGSSVNGLLLDDFSINSATTTGIVDDRQPGLPLAYTLRPNYPNPFNPSTKISFALPVAQEVTLKFFDLTGKEVAALLQNEQMAAGVHEVVFDAGSLPTGVYFYRLEAKGFVETRKMLLAR